MGESAIKATASNKKRIAGKLGGTKSGMQKLTAASMAIDQDIATVYGGILAAGTRLGWPSDSTRAFKQTCLPPANRVIVSGMVKDCKKLEALKKKKDENLENQRRLQQNAVNAQQSYMQSVADQEVPIVGNTIAPASLEDVQSLWGPSQ